MTFFRYVLLLACSISLAAPLRAAEEPPQGYTINYDTIPIVEYLRFAGKICNTNFIFNEAELNFTVSVLSDAPITPENVMATLVQVLRIHGMTLLEQGNSLVIHKSQDVKQLAELVTGPGQAKGAAIVTRIFRLKNSKPESILGIVQPMISSTAILEASPETRQLILTDVNANVEKIAGLIEIIDSPHTPLEIKTYPVQHNSPEYLVSLADKIMAPIAQGNPFLLVSQSLANTIFVISTPELVERSLAILADLDVEPKPGKSLAKPVKGENIFVYKVAHRPAAAVLLGLQEMIGSLGKSETPENDLLETIHSGRALRDSNSLMFTGSPESIGKLKEFLAVLDVPSQDEMIKNNFFLYRPQHKSAEELQVALLEMAKNLSGAEGADPALLSVLEKSKVNPSTNTLSFAGDERVLAKVKELLHSVDIAGGKEGQFLTYKPKYMQGEQLAESLKEVTGHLQADPSGNQSFLRTLKSMKWVKSTQSFLFTGDSASLQRVSELIASIDSPHAAAASAQKDFFLYRPLHASQRKTEEYLEQLSSSLDKKTDRSLLAAIRSAKWVAPSQSFLFHGSQPTLDKLKSLLEDFDTPEAQRPPSAASSFAIYPLQHISEQKAEGYLDQVAENLEKKGTDPDLVETIKARKWISDSNSFMFQGTERSLTEVKDLLKTYDTASTVVAEEKRSKSGYFLYKLQHTSGEEIEDDLDHLAKTLKDSSHKDPEILKVIEGIRYVKETNSLLLTGNPRAIEEVKAILADYDHPRSGKASGQSNFLLYKPQHVSGKQIKQSLDDLSVNLKKAGLADSPLLDAIASAKYVETTNSLVFTGPPESLQKIEGLIKEIDIPPQKHAPIQHMGQTTFLLYKLKQAGGPQILSSLKSMTANLKKVGGADKEFIAALQSAKYIKETHSLLFTGSEQALLKVQAFVEQFDVQSLSEPSAAAASLATPAAALGPDQFFVYKPQSLPGPELEKILIEFAENLKMSGLSDPPLFQTIASMRYIEKTQSLVFTGTTKGLDQVKGLLKEFDIPSNLGDNPLLSDTLGPSIQAIDNTSFLVYKLQFHKGDEIQNALRQIAKDLINSNAPINQNLLNSINSIQWLEVTNSLLCSGDQETLTRLRELIKNLDIPLKQVFIEMLVIETNLSNTLNFGLEWGANYKYRNKFGGSMFNTVPNTSTNTDPAAQFVQNLSGLAPPAPPTPVGNIPPTGGFDMGVIGEIIKHNGNTFLSLGSLLTALQSDTESSVLMTPKILTQDGRTSSIFVGQNIPFTGSFLTNSGTGTTIIQSANLEYRDIGLNLTITPVLGNSDIVTLDIALDRTQAVATPQGQGTTVMIGNQTGSAPTTTRTSMQTTVHVPDKHFLILSGFANNTNTKQKAGIPCLGGLPLVGAAFSQSNDQLTTTNIVIFLRPHIVVSADEMRQLSSDQEEFYRDLVPTPFLEHQYREGMELIKTVDDL